MSKSFLFYQSSIIGHTDKMKIRNTDSYIIKQPIRIPNGDMSFNDFCNLMYVLENQFINTIITK